MFGALSSAPRSCARLGQARWISYRDHKTILSQSGPRVFGWGAGGEFQLASEYPHDGINVPTEIDALRDLPIRGVSAGWLVSYALTADGEVFGWGSNKYFQLLISPQDNNDNNSSTHIRSPTRLTMPGRIRAIGAGRGHTAFLDERGRVHTVGTADLGQLGNGQSGDNEFNQQLQEVKGALAGHHVQSIAVGFDHTLALTTEGKVFGWGIAAEGQVGSGDVEEDQDSFAEPQELDEEASGEPLPRIKKVAAGTDHSAVLSESGNLYMFGSNCVHQLGVGPADEYVCALMPVRLHGELEGHRIVDVALGGVHSFALTESGEVFCWGWNDEGRLGLPKEQSDDPQAQHFVSFAQRHDELSKLGVKALYSGGAHTIAITKNDELYSFGFGMNGRLGLGHTETVCSPSAIKVLNHPRTWNQIIDISIGVDHTLLAVQ